jgi:hypothetical protein
MHTCAWLRTGYPTSLIFELWILWLLYWMINIYPDSCVGSTQQKHRTGKILRILWLAFKRKESAVSTSYTRQCSLNCLLRVKWRGVREDFSWRKAPWLSYVAKLHQSFSQKLCDAVPVLPTTGRASRLGVLWHDELELYGWYLVPRSKQFITLHRLAKWHDHSEGFVNHENQAKVKYFTNKSEILFS